MPKKSTVTVFYTIGTACSLTSWCNFPPAHMKPPFPCMAELASTRWWHKIHLIELPFKPETPDRDKKCLDPGKCFKWAVPLSDADRSQIWNVMHNYPRVFDSKSPNNCQHYAGSPLPFPWQLSGFDFSDAQNLSLRSIG